MNRPSSQGRVSRIRRIIALILLSFLFVNVPLQAFAESATADSSAADTVDTAAATTKSSDSPDATVPDEKPVDPDGRAVEASDAPTKNFDSEELPPTDDSDDAQLNNTSLASSVTLKPDQVSGALVYQYPITLPPGRNHLQPDLALTYNSQSAVNGGIVGYGWTVNIPYIERSNRKGSDVLYDANYGAYFDSSISGNLVSADSVIYHPEVDDGSFLKYSFDGTSWIVTDKNGNTFKYGVSADARQDDPNNTAHVYRWYLEEERDANDNYIRYTYTKDGGQIYPSAVFYTGHGSSDGIFEVDFGLEARSDTPTLHSTGFSVKSTERVSAITIKTKGAISRSYALSYAISTESVRSLLHSITESGYDTGGTMTTLPPTTFTYTTSGPAGWSLNDWQFDHTDQFPLQRRQVLGVFDASGDALADILKAYPDYEPGGSVTYSKGADRGWNTSASSSLPSTFVTNVHYEMGDYNGDGYIDLMQDQRYANDLADGPNDYFNDRNGNWVIQPELAPPHTQHGYAKTNESGFATVDVNGDGLDDIILNSHDDGRRTFINEGTNGWSERGWGTPDFGLFPKSSVPTIFTDLNGDGISDVVSDDSSHAHIAMGINNGAKDWNNNDGPWYIPPNNGLLYHGSPTGFIGDVNGDGLPDLILEETERNGVPGVFLNRGDGSGWATTSDPRFDLPYDFGASDAGLTIFADTNGDGIADIAGFNGYRGFIYTNHATKPDLLSRISLPTGGSNEISYKQSPQFQGESGPTNPRLPSVLSLVSSIATDDGLGNTGITTYSYEGGEYYFATSTPPAPYERKFAGFSKVSETDPDGSVTITYFHQGNGTDSAHGEYQDDPAKIGHPYRIETYDQSGNLFRTIINKWGATAGVASSTFVPLLQSVTSDYDGDTDHLDKAETYSYNAANGDLTQRVEWGQVNAADDGSFTDVGSDTFVNDTSYATSSSTPLSVPDQLTTADQAGNRVRQTTNYYDNLSFGQAAQGNLTKQLQWIGGTTTAETDTTYNSYGLPTQTKDPRGNATNYTYDSYNLYPATTTNALGYTSAALYDYSAGKPKQTTNENGATFKTVFDGLGRITEQDEPNPTGGGLSLPSTLVAKAKYVYTDDSTPREVQETDYLNSNSSTVSYTYLDGFGRIVQHLTTAEDANTYAAVTNTYDSRGLLQSESLPYFVNSSAYSGLSAPPPAELLTTYAYDALQRPTAITNTLGVTRNAYDQWVMTTTDANGHIHEYAKDPYNNLTQVVEHNDDGNYATSYQYDGNNNLTELTDANGNTRHFTYDGLNRRLSAEDLHAASSTFGIWTYGYDNAGNLTTQNDPKNQTTNFTYDALNRPLTEDFTGSSGTEVAYGYDTCAYGKMQLCAATTSAAINAFTYTPLGQRATESATIAGQRYTTSYTYDRLGNKVLITYPDSSQVRYVYNAAGLLDSISQKGSSDPSFSSIVQDFDYAPTGKVAYEQFGNGVSSTYTYDPDQLYRLTHILTIASTTPAQNEEQVQADPKQIQTHSSGGQKSPGPVVSSPAQGSSPAPTPTPTAGSQIPSLSQNLIDKAIDAAPLATSSLPATGTPSISTHSKLKVAAPAQAPSLAAIQDIQYSYDRVGNITDIADYSSTQAAHVSAFTYDFLNRLKTASTTAASSTPYSQTYTYDKTGSITYKSDLGTYSYTGADNANPQAPNTIGTSTLKYDKDGNLTKYGGNPFTWDYRNRLTSAAENGATSTYAYDFQNNRVLKTTATSTNYYPNDLYSTGGANARRNIFSADGALVAVVKGPATSTKVFTIHPDNLGSTNVITDSTGSSAGVTDYYPYGAQRVNQGADIMRKYIGEEYDDDTDLSYLNSRYMDGSRGHFLSQDPSFLALGSPDQVKQLTQQDQTKVLANPQALNAYSYAQDNPIINKDPSGNFDFGWDALLTVGFVAFDLYNIHENGWNKTTSGNLTLDAAGFIPGVPVFAGELARTTALSGDAAKALEAYQRTNASGQALMDGVSSQKVLNLIADNYRAGAQIGKGSTADAVRYTADTGILIGDSDHIEKAQTTISRINNLFQKYATELNTKETDVLNHIYDDLQNALRKTKK